MKTVWYLLAAGLLLQSARASELSLDGGLLHLNLDRSTGRITHLYNGGRTEDYLYPEIESPLLQVKRYSKPDLLVPERMEVLARKKRSVVFRLFFDKETSLTLRAGEGRGWIHLEILSGKGVKDIEAVRWGPVRTRLEEGVGTFFGVLHGKEVSIGLMPLEPNTDGAVIGSNGKLRLRDSRGECAAWLPWPHKGSKLFLDALDHTRSQPLAPLRTSDVVPKTVIGSKVALWLAPKGRELDVVEGIVKAERLPYPINGGEWNKRSKKILAPSVWSWFDERNVGEVLDFCASIDGENICPFGHMFANWGHFEPDPDLYSKGWNSLKAIAADGERRGIRLTFYTLTDFIKPITRPEPYIAPRVDPRFERYDTEGVLLREVDATNGAVAVAASPELRKLVEGKGSKQAHMLLQLGEELVSFTNAVAGGRGIRFSGCGRGWLKTAPAPHEKASKVRFLYYAGYNNLFPGTLEMSHEVAERIGTLAAENGFGKVTLDGHESALETGVGPLAMNDAIQTIYRANAKRDVLYTGSRMTAWSWYIISYISWGEFDKGKGFRGTMLDLRIRRQIQLEKSLMPHKLGQHYPDEATLEDINWLMGQAIGWDAGVEFDTRPSEFAQNPQAGEIKAAIRTWEKARMSGKVTARQKLLLRQIDRVYGIEQSAAKWRLVPLQKHWADPRCKRLESSVVKLENLARSEPARPCSINLDWTHSPLIYTAAALSDDIPLASGQWNAWKVAYPAEGANSSDINGNQLKFVLRVPADSPCGIRNPVFAVDSGQHFMLPVDLKPGQYLATPLNAPFAFVYNRRHQVVAQVPVRYRNDLPDMNHRQQFTIECSFESLKSNAPAHAVLNLFYSEVLHTPTYP